MVVCVHLRLLRMIAVATTATITITAAIAMYTVIGIPLDVCGAGLGDAEIVCVGCELGDVVWIDVGVAVGVGVFALVDVVGLAYKCVSAFDG